MEHIKPEVTNHKSLMEQLSAITHEHKFYGRQKKFG